MRVVGQLTNGWLPASFGAIALASTAGLGWVAGHNLNLLLVSTLTAAIVAPAFGASGRGVVDAAALVAAGSIGVGAGWVAIGHSPSTGFALELNCISVVAALLSAEVGTCRLLVACRANRAVAGAVVTTLGAVWLAWPLWTATAPPFCVRVNPLLAVNGVVADALGIWTEQPIAYPWIALGQDVSYQLPTSPWACIGIHLGVGVIAIACTLGIERAAPVRPAALD